MIERGESQFSEKEKEQFMLVRQKIARWIYENIVPFVEDKEITVSYGDTMYGGGERTSEWCLVVNKNGVGVRHGFGGADWINQHGEYIDHPLFPTNLALALFRNWDGIKPTLLDKLDAIKRESKKLETFEA